MNKLKRPKNIHHQAFLCRDAEQTRWFYEDVMGFKLVTALDIKNSPGSNEPLEYMHIFFEMGNGDHIAFFDIPDEVEEEKFNYVNGLNQHIAFEVDTFEELESWRKHLNKEIGWASDPIDHDFIHSIYFYDPNGLALEITCRDKDYNQIMEKDKKEAHKNLESWTKRTRSKKESKVGPEKLDERVLAVDEVINRLKISGLIK
ncbi:MAG: VOC family protein [Pseudomonadota bacterium]|nr:VOC family protein [Pseudomonadota bacterium]